MQIRFRALSEGFAQIAKQISSLVQIETGPLREIRCGDGAHFCFFFFIARACNFFYHRCLKCVSSYVSRAEVMTECDIHHTRFIKTNSGVNLSRKPGLDLCCDLLQQLQGVPRTCRF